MCSNISSIGLILMKKVLMKVKENAEFRERKKVLDRNLLNSGGGVSKKRKKYI